jgi:hypothetical protein
MEHTNALNMFRVKMRTAGSRIHGVTYNKAVILYVFVKRECAEKKKKKKKKRHLSEV